MHRASRLACHSQPLHCGGIGLTLSGGAGLRHMRAHLYRAALARSVGVIEGLICPSLRRSWGKISYPTPCDAY